MKYRAWTEDRDVRPINTGGGMLETRKGDLVVCIVIEKWADHAEAIRQLQMLIGSKEP